MLIVVGALGTIPKGFRKGTADMEIRVRVETVQTISLFRLARHFQKVLWKNINYFKEGGSSFGDLGNIYNPFIAITPRSTLTLSPPTYYGPIYGSNRSV